MAPYHSYFKPIGDDQTLEQFALCLIDNSLLYRDVRRQNGELTVENHLLPVQYDLKRIIIHPKFADLVAAFGLLHDIVEDFPNYIRCQDPYRYRYDELARSPEYPLSLNYLLKPAGEAGQQLVYCIDKPTKRYVEKGRKYSEIIFTLHRHDPLLLALDLIVVNMKNCDIAANTNPDESAQCHQQKFITKKLRNALRYLYYDLPRIHRILTMYQEFTYLQHPLFDYPQAKKIVEHNYANVLCFLERNPIYTVMKKNIENGHVPLGWPSLKDLTFYREALEYLIEDGFCDRFERLDDAIILLSQSWKHGK